MKTGTEREEKDRRRHEKREDSFSVWWCMVVFCWCSDFLARDLSLLNSVKYVPSLISFSVPWQVNSFFYYLRIIDSLQLQFAFFCF